MKAGELLSGNSPKTVGGLENDWNTGAASKKG